MVSLNMERNEISLHEIKIAQALRLNSGKWLTHKQIQQIAGAVSDRTVRAKTIKFVELGLIDVAEVFPAHRYQWSEHAKRRNTAYLNRLDKALEVFGEDAVI